LAYDASTGGQLWVARYNGPDNGDDNILSNYALGVSPDGSKVFVTGYTTTISSAADYATVAYDASTGTQLWATLFDGPAHSNDLAYALGVSPDGSKVFVTGSSTQDPNGDNYAAVAYDVLTGGQLWARFYNGPGNSDDSALALGVSPDGSKVFVTGYSRRSTSNRDYATVAYDVPTGEELWVARYIPGPANNNDRAYALGVSPDGSKVFVTGYSYGSTGNTGRDYATVAYSVT
jgi:glucose dehydrogenase